MAFQKGREKTGGRRPGSTNLLTKDLRGRVFDIVERNLAGLEGTLEQMEPRERVAVLLKLMEFILPKAREEEAKEATIKILNGGEMTAEQYAKLKEIAENLPTH